MPYTTYGSEQSTRQTTNLTPFTWPPGQWWLSLHTSSPGDSGAGEVSGGGYSRKLVTWQWDSTLKQARNSQDIVFANLPGGSPSQTITHYALFNAATGGTCILHSPLTEAKVTFSGDQLTFDAQTGLTLKEV